MARSKQQPKQLHEGKISSKDIPQGIIVLGRKWISHTSTTIVTSPSMKMKSATHQHLRSRESQFQFQFQSTESKKKPAQLYQRRRYRPSNQILGELNRRFQKPSGSLIKKSSFQRLVQGIVLDCSSSSASSSSSLSPSAAAVGILHGAAESYLAQLLEDAKLCAMHAGRAHITKKDLLLSRRIRG